VLGGVFEDLNSLLVVGVGVRGGNPEVLTINNSIMVTGNNFDGGNNTDINLLLGKMRNTKNSEPIC
jgi:hypothetical protein